MGEAAVLALGLEPLGSHLNRRCMRQKGEDNSWWSTCDVQMTVHQELLASTGTYGHAMDWGNLSNEMDALVPGVEYSLVAHCLLF
jgi:hypothetical protein